MSDDGDGVGGFACSQRFKMSFYRRRNPGCGPPERGTFQSLLSVDKVGMEKSEIQSRKIPILSLTLTNRFTMYFV